MKPTAKEFMNDIKNVTYSQEELMIEFAKLHVEAALKQASEKAEIDIDDNGGTTATLDKNSILNAYPLTNIK